MASAGITALLKKMDYKDVVIAIDGSLFRFRLGATFPSLFLSPSLSGPGLLLRLVVVRGHCMCKELPVIPFRGHCMCKELPVIPVNKVVDQKRIIGKMEGRPPQKDWWYGQMWHFIICQEHNNSDRIFHHSSESGSFNKTLFLNLQVIVVLKNQ
jgi:hypothetical protein